MSFASMNRNISQALQDTLDWSMHVPVLTRKTNDIPSDSTPKEDVIPHHDSHGDVVDHRPPKELRMLLRRCAQDFGREWEYRPRMVVSIASPFGTIETTLSVVIGRGRGTLYNALVLDNVSVPDAGTGSTRERAIGDWILRFERQFASAFEEVALKQEWRTSPTWRAWDSYFGLDRFDPITIDFFGQVVVNDGTSLKVKWVNTGDDEPEEVAHISKSQRLRHLAPGDWFRTLVVQRLDTHEIACFLNCEKSDPPRREPLTADEREELIKLFEET